MDTLGVLMVIFVPFLTSTKYQASALTTYYPTCGSWINKNTATEVEVGATYTSDSSGILKTSLFGGYEGDLNCKIVLKPPYGNGIILSIRKLDFRLNCKDSITIKDSYGLIQGTYCNDKDDPYEFTSHYSSGEMTIIFKTGSGEASSLYSGFELVYTAYSGTPCTFSEFKCPRGCIWKNLKCDGHNHCGDRSDQIDCDISITTDDNYVVYRRSVTDTTDVGVILGSIFGSLFLLIVIIAGAIYIKRRQVTVGSVLHPPHHPQQPYGAQYPAPGMYPGSLYPQPGQMNYPPPPQYSPTQVQQTGHDNAGFQ